MGVNIFSIGVGINVDFSEIFMVVKDFQYLYKINFRGLGIIVKCIKDKVCVGW